MFFFGGHWYPWFGSLVTSPGFQSQSGFCLIHIFAEANVMYIPQDPPMVLHMPTSWQPAAQSVMSPHASAEVGFGLDLNGQSLRQKMNVLPLCKRPGLYLSRLRNLVTFR